MLNLPVYDGLQEQLELLNKKRKDMLDDEKTEARRIELKKERTLDAQHRKEWSKKHGHHTYGDTVEESSAKTVTAGQSKKGSATKCYCGSTTHKRSTHKNCPLRNRYLTAPVHEVSEADISFDAEGLTMNFVELPCSDDEVFLFDGQ